MAAKKAGVFPHQGMICGNPNSGERFGTAEAVSCTGYTISKIL
jgi:hypothetical protein